MFREENFASPEELRDYLRRQIEKEEGQAWICLFCKATFHTHTELVGHIFSDHQGDMEDLGRMLREMLEVIPQPLEPIILNMN